MKVTAIRTHFNAIVKIGNFAAQKFGRERIEKPLQNLREQMATLLQTKDTSKVYPALIGIVSFFFHFIYANVKPGETEFAAMFLNVNNNYDALYDILEQYLDDDQMIQVAQHAEKLRNDIDAANPIGSISQQTLERANDHAHRVEQRNILISAMVRCAHCSNLNKKKCSACGCTRYCSVECQRVDWPIHKSLCGKLAAMKKRLGEVALAFETNDTPDVTELEADPNSTFPIRVFKIDGYLSSSYPGYYVTNIAIDEKHAVYLVYDVINKSFNSKYV